MREYYPKELELRISGRCVWHEDNLFLCHSASYVEFMLKGERLEAEFASEGGGEDFQAWIGVFVNDVEEKRIPLKAGANRYLLWESETADEVKIRLVKMSENQYAYASIQNIFSKHLVPGLMFTTKN